VLQVGQSPKIIFVYSVFSEIYKLCISISVE